MNFRVGEVLSRAYETVIRNKVLWALGLVAALLAGAGSDRLKFSENRVEFFDIRVDPTPELVAWMSAAGLVVVIIALLLRAVIDAGLIAAGDRSARGDAPTFGEAWREGIAHIWPMVGLYFIFIALVVAMVLGIVLAMGLGVGGVIGLAALFFPQSGAGVDNAGAVLSAVGAGLFILLALLVVMMIALVALGAITQFAQRAVVLEGESLGQALGSGWRLMKGNLGRVLGVMLAQFLVSILVGAVTALVLGIIVVPAALGLSANQGAMDLPFVLAVVLLAGALWVLNALVSALPTAWNSTVWTLFYRAATTGMPEVADRHAGFGGAVQPPMPGALTR